MNNPKLLVMFFAVMVLAQLYVPVSMVVSSEKVLSEGVEYKFKIDTHEIAGSIHNDLIRLPFENNSIAVKDKDNWKKFEPAFVSISTDNEGFAIISAISKSRPPGDAVFFKARVNHVEERPDKVVVTLPFEVYYPETGFSEEESERYRKILSDTTRNVYALVKVLNGKALLQDIFVDDIPLKEAANQGSPTP